MSEPLTDGQRVISRARSLMQNGKAHGWSHALSVAADSLKRDDDTPPRRPRPTVYLTPRDRAMRAIGQRLEFARQQLGEEWAIVLAARVLVLIDQTLLPELEAEIELERYERRVVRRKTRH